MFYSVSALIYILFLYINTISTPHHLHISYQKLRNYGTDIKPAKTIIRACCVVGGKLDEVGGMRLIIERLIVAGGNELFYIISVEKILISIWSIFKLVLCI